MSFCPSSTSPPFGHLEAMGDVLAELEDVLRSKPTKDKITAVEDGVLQGCKVAAMRDFTVGALASSAVAWAASRSLKSSQRFNVAVGSAILSGIWTFNRSLNTCLEQILGLEGSRMQGELARIILIKHWNNESRMKLVRKYFYPEQVYNDVNPDKAVLRWRYRSSYIDSGAIQRTEGTEDSSSSTGPQMQPKQFTRSTGGDMIADPLDCIFGYPEQSNEIKDSDNGNIPQRRRSRAHRRARRHYQIHRSETSDELAHQK